MICYGSKWTVWRVTSFSTKSESGLLAECVKILGLARLFIYRTGRCDGHHWRAARENHGPLTSNWLVRQQFKIRWSSYTSVCNHSSYPALSIVFFILKVNWLSELAGRVPACVLAGYASSHDAAPSHGAAPSHRAEITCHIPLSRSVISALIQTIKQL